MSTTKTVGYFNPNRWPVIVNISAVNVNLTIGKGGYVVDRDTGKKVNDPILERYVGPDMLARESSKVEVPLVLFPRPTPVVSGAHHNGVASSANVTKDDRGFVQDSSFDGVVARGTGIAEVPPASGHSVATYSVTEAVKRGIFKPVIIPDDSNAPKETDGQPVRGDNLPPIMHARDATPAEARRLALTGTIRHEAPVEVVKEKTVPVVDEAQHEDAEGAGSESLDVGEHLKKLQSQLESPDAPAAPAPVAVAEPAKPVPLPGSQPNKFVCAADGRSFKKKGFLLNHVKKHFAGREAELMAPYAADADT
jgi:hypothetical protein